MNALDILQLRLRNQYLHQPISGDPADAVRWLGAVQAQDYLGALWAVGLRTHGATERGIEQAIADRAIVRTWFMRGTLHFVAAADYRWMIDLMGPRMRRLVDNTARTNNAELHESTFAKANDAITAALSGGRHMIRDELARTLEAAGIPASALRLSLLLQRAQADGLVCYGPRRGKQVTHVLVDEWLPLSPPLDREAGLSEFAGRYFQSHGPATAEDYAWWSGLTLTDARAALRAVAGMLGSVEVDGRTYWMPPVVSSPKGDSRSAHLLWGFDEYVVAYKDRRAVFSDVNIERAKALGGGMLRPVVVVGGRAVGNWRRKPAKSGVTVEIDYFERTSSRDRLAVGEAADAYGQFLGLPVTVVDRPL